MEDLMLLVFDTLDYNSLNHPIFIDQLLSTLRSLGLAEKHASSLQIKLSPGSVVAEIFGPPAVRKHLEAVPLQYVEVMGCYARKLPRAPPRPKQSRPVSSLSDATVLSADSSRHMETQANQLLNMWLETPKSDALTTRSDMDTIANQMVSHFVVCSSDADPRCQVQWYQVHAHSSKLLHHLWDLATLFGVPFLKFPTFANFPKCLAPKPPQPLRRLALKNLLGRPFWQPKQRPNSTRSWWKMVEAVEMPMSAVSAVRWFPYVSLRTTLAGYCRKWADEQPIILWSLDTLHFHNLLCHFCMAHKQEDAFA